MRRRLRRSSMMVGAAFDGTPALGTAPAAAVGERAPPLSDGLARGVSAQRLDGDGAAL
jgi:hypothetical protein